MKPGPRPEPAWNLKVAALEYAAAVESEHETRREWDRLRRAALRYQEGERPPGRQGRP